MASTTVRYRKEPPSQKDVPDLKFVYSSSNDSIDENLLVLFHGLGDTPENFINFGKKMNLPQTAIIAIRGPIPIPYFEETGWFAAYDRMGEEVPQAHPEVIRTLHQTRTTLTSFFPKHIISSSAESSKGWLPRKIFLLGFSQGGAAAIDFALYSGINGLGGVISISGWPAAEWYKGEAGVRSEGLKVLITQGRKDQVVPASLITSGHTFLKSAVGESNLEVVHIEGKGHAMPSTEAEVRTIMKFFGTNLFLRNIALETTPGIVEVK
ncbi:hypothetical protein HK097_002051 [Rhizophlyctis rosea]|uniref:Phospholipase/carboxylesterase/thioesterase domain-containing protein n=1 Tax=Rhizophlyctis rosea TaxID=64517 RepID=A0AAD5SH42_9FUNG|nr:hypothetical protein HK097_002051 [Rhizophlyctis rosea]